MSRRGSVAFCEYFSSVFTKADVSLEQRLNLKADITELDIEFHEEKILKMLEKLNVSKSPVDFYMKLGIK